MSQLEELTTAQLATDLVNEIKKLLTENKFETAVAAIHDNKYNACLKENSWDLIPLLTQYLAEETNKNDPELFDCCEQLLLVVAEKSNPEEALLEFIEQAELAVEDVKFFAVLKPLQKTLLKLTNKRGRSLEWVFNTIQSHITDQLPEQGEYKYENEEKILQDADGSVYRISLFYSELLPFYKPFIDEILLKELTPEIKQRRDLIACFMLQLLGKPLACLNLEIDLETKSRARLCAEQIMIYLNDLVGDCFKFLYYINDRRKKPVNDIYGVKEYEILDVFACEEKTPILSLGVYYYLILSENIQYKQIPLVYHPLYIFQSIFTVVADLLSYSEQFITRKGLLLAHALIFNENIPIYPYDILDSPSHCLFCTNLMNIMIYSDFKEYREFGMKIFKTYFFKFDFKGRYLLISNLMNIIDNGNARGYFVFLYKETIIEAFDKDQNNLSEFYSGSRLFHMLKVFCHLPEGDQTDLMVFGDQLITALNLLIYIAIRDKYNASGIWNTFETLENIFLKPLKQGILISKAHYNLKLNELQNEKGQGDGANSKFAVTVKEFNLPGMSKKDKKTILVNSMNSFNALEMHLVRLEEIIAEGPSI